MSITIRLDLPEALLEEAKASGLLESASMGSLLETELRRRKAAAELKHVLDGIQISSDKSERPQECYEILLLLIGEFSVQNQIEILNRVVERQQPAIM